MSISSGESGGGSGGWTEVIGYAVPNALYNMMITASADQGVPVPVLVQIWAIESGGTYPNPAVNPQGYGGLFGLGQGQYYGGIGPINNYDTSEDSELNQCEAAAQDLATLVNQAGGDVFAAMQRYDDGATSESNAIVAAWGAQVGTVAGPVPPVETVASVQAQQNVPSSIPSKSSAAWDAFRVGFNTIIPSIVGDITAIKNGWGAQGNGGVAGGPYR